MQTQSPESLGLDTVRLESAADLIRVEIEKGTIGAASLTVARNGAIAWAEGYGFRVPGSSETVTGDSVFLLASISKPLSICAVMQRVERGKIKLDDPVRAYLPEFSGSHKEDVLVRHLLTHTSGMPDMLPENVDLRKAHTPMSGFVEGALRTPLLFEPGTAFRYQSKGILLACEIVERLTDTPFRAYLDKELFEPLGMTATSLGLGGRAIEDTVWCGTEATGEEAGTEWGWNSPYWRDAGHPWGGVHSSGPDLVKILQACLNGGALDGRSLFDEDTVNDMIRDQNGHLSAPWGLGWGLRDSPVWTYFGDVCSPDSFGHVGATGTVAWADPKSGLSCVVLASNMVEDGRLLNEVSNKVAKSISD